MPLEPRPRKLRKREVVLAVSMGALAAGGAAAMLAGISGGGGPDRASPIDRSREMTYSVADFEEIATEGPQQVEVTFGETFSAESEGSARALAQLEVVVEDGVLKIRPKDPARADWSSFETTTVRVTLPLLERVSMAGTGNVRVDRIKSDSFSGTIAGAGQLQIGTMDVDEADFSINGLGSGSVTASGTARATRVSIGGNGEVNAGGLRSKTASVSIGGYGEVKLTVDDEARVSIGGAGDVDIAGTARCSVTQMGSGDVRCAGGGGTDND
jgi:hypothetical protein